MPVTMTRVSDEFLRAAPSTPVGKWTPWTLSAYPPENAAFLEVWFHSFNAALVTAYLDDIELVRLDAASIKPPWPGTYKIYPQETTKLTAADVVGPEAVGRVRAHDPSVEFELIGDVPLKGIATAVRLHKATRA